MARVLVTGSSDGIGQLTARALIAQGHSVVLHARNQKRASDAMAGCPGAEQVIVADLSSIAETKHAATEANKLGCDVVIFNAGLGFRDGLNRTKDDLPAIFAVNSLSPYILTSLMNRPKHVVYVSSGLNSSGSANMTLNELTWRDPKSWNGFQAYCDSKLHNVLLAFAVSRYWPDVTSNAVDPGWVPTKMGGAGARESLEKSYETQLWLAVGDGKTQTGRYFKNKEPGTPHRTALDHQKQDEFLRMCEQISGVPFPK